MKKIVPITALGAAVMALSGCGDWTTSSYPTGEITELSYKETWIETDCVMDSLGEAESCTAKAVDDCYLVRFVNDDGIEFSDCTDKGVYEDLKEGQQYTDD